jgi:hypothetical protein
MQVRTIQGDTSTLAAILYPPPDNSLLEYLNNNIQYAVDKLGDISSGFIDNVTNIYNRYNSASVLQAGKQLLYSTGIHLNQNVIIPVAYNDLPNANIMMQSYILEQPRLRELYNKNMVDGYSDTYLDPEPDVTDGYRTKYTRTMDGVLQFEEEDEQLGYVKYYSDDEVSPDLDIYDKISILDTWHNVALAIAADVDPTTLEEL